jgi:hypothetical protein
VGDGARGRAGCESESGGGAGGSGRSARSSEPGERRGNRGGIREYGSDGELSTALDADAKVNVERSFEKRTPVETGARCVQLATEQDGAT